MATHVLAIDQGTTSTRAVLVGADGRIRAVAGREHQQFFPRPGWVEHDPAEIWTNVVWACRQVLAETGLTAADIAAVGITNQRETTVVWDRATGEAIHPAIVWQDTRTQQICEDLAADGGVRRFAAQTGLPLASYFAGPKISWILDHVPGARKRAEDGELAAGTIDSWLIWHLTGGGAHLTDVTNASRTLLMDLRSLAWDEELAATIGVPMAVLPEIRPSLGHFGDVTALPELAGLPITGVLGDQQAALFGQACFQVGMAKNTYGTGNFLLLNTGTEPMVSKHGLLTTVAYQREGHPAIYALEGSIAVTGSLVHWLRDNLGIISASSDIEELAASVADNGGCYFVPAFSGLFAPHWRPDARGVLAGLTRFITAGHIARAALEATAYQTREVVEAMAADSGVPLAQLRVDGGMSANELLMQFQADQLNVPVVRPVSVESTALGAAQAAGLQVGLWSGLDELAALWQAGRCWEPGAGVAERERLFAGWAKAVTKSLGWVDD